MIDFYDDWANVRLVSYTQVPDYVVDEEVIGSPLELVAYCARVSSPNSQTKNLNAEKLVNYLIKHKHWSPLEMVDVTLEINTARDIGRQMLRHRSASFQEWSGRYAISNQFVTRAARRQDTENRQNSIDDLPHEVQLEWENRQLALLKQVNEDYEWAIANNIAKECARVVLPEGLTKSKLYMKASLRTWIHYIELRSANGTQKEHEQIALACAEVIGEIFPQIDNYTNRSN